MTGAKLLVETLRTHGVKTLFTLSGNQILSIYDATIGRGIDFLHTRREAEATHMADGWGRLTEAPGVALVTAGPGHLNAISALYSALMAESPMVLLSGHAPRAQRGRGAFQEIDQAGAARPIVKAAWVAESAEGLGDDLARAFAIATSGRPDLSTSACRAICLRRSLRSRSRYRWRRGSNRRASPTRPCDGSSISSPRPSVR